MFIVLTIDNIGCAHAHNRKQIEPNGFHRMSQREICGCRKCVASFIQSEGVCCCVQTHLVCARFGFFYVRVQILLVFRFKLDFHSSDHEFVSSIIFKLRSFNDLNLMNEWVKTNKIICCGQRKIKKSFNRISWFGIVILNSSEKYWANDWDSWVRIWHEYMTHGCYKVKQSE